MRSYEWKVLSCEDVPHLEWALNKMDNEGWECFNIVTKDMGRGYQDRFVVTFRKDGRNGIQKAASRL